MADDRREPTISGIRPEKDEIVRHSARISGKKSPGRSAPPSQKVGAPPSSGSSNGLVFFALLLALVSLGGSAYLYYQLTLSHTQMQEARNRIEKLEGQLELSDDEASASLTTIQAKLKWADSEIRKLWGVSYDTNRKNIAANTESISDIQGSLKSLNSNFSKVSNELKILRQSLGDFDQFAEQFKNQKELLTSLDNRFSRQQTQVQALIDRLTQIEQQADSLQEKVTDNVQAIDAIDTFRRDVNRQLLQLRPAPNSAQ